MSTDTAVAFNPFPGLRPFREEEEYLFFGRESQVDAILDKLAAGRLLAVMGASGSGKSSLVNCGLIPALHGGLMARAGSAWKVAHFRPGGDPLKALAHALAEALFADYDAGSLSPEKIIETTLRMSKRGLIESYEQAHLPEHVNLLVVVDQFEELFRYGQVRASQDQPNKGRLEDDVAFINLLLEAVNQNEAPIYVTLTMRSDFLEECAQLAGLPEAINDGQYLVPRMTRDERKAAIAGPVAVGGSVIEPTLLTRLVNDVGDNPDQLSILQHALNRTWAHWQQQEAGKPKKPPLVLRHYEAIGTMERALDEHAERAYAELDSPRKRDICEKIFKALTFKGGDLRGVRRPTKLVTLCALAGAHEADAIAEVIAVIDIFRKPSRSFLMPPVPEPLHAETVVDISHESLMRIWDRLKRWAEEEAASANMYLRLARDAVLYEAGRASLWRDPQLQLAEDWRQANRPTQHWALQYHPAYEAAMGFLDASLAQREEEARAAVALQQRELENAKALAAAEARSARRFRIGFMLAAALAIIAVVATIFALGLRQSALKARDTAQTAQQAAKDSAAVAQRERDNARLAEQAAKDSAAVAQRERDNARLAEKTALDNAEKARLAGQAAFDSAAVAQRERDNAQRAEQAALDNAEKAQSASKTAEDQRNRAERERRRTVGVTLASAARRQQDNNQTELGALLARQAYIFNPQDSTGSDFLNDVYDALRQSLEKLPDASPPSHELDSPDNAAVKAVAYSSQGWMASGDEDGNITLWRTDASQDQGLTLPGGNRIQRLVFSPDGSVLITASRGQPVKLWRIPDTGRPVEATLPNAPGTAKTVAYSPDGRYLAAVGDDNTIRIWNTGNGNITPASTRFNGHTGAVRALAYSRPDGRTLASAGADNTVRLWDAATGEERNVLTGHTRPIHAIAYSPDGRLLVTGGDDTDVRVWDAVSGVSKATLVGHQGPVFALAFSPNGRLLATGSGDQTVRLWRVENGTVRSSPIILRGHQRWVRSLAFSPDSKQLISGSGDKTVRVWKIDAAELADEICLAVGNNTLTVNQWQEFVGLDIPYSDQKLCPPK